MRDIRQHRPIFVGQLWQAAPDLLKACKAALIRLERLDDAGTGEHSPVYLQVQAAIAKAEGRAQ